MNEGERFEWEHKRGWTLPAFMARFVEVFECNERRTKKVLNLKYLVGRHSKAENHPNEMVGEAVDRSESASSQEVYRKTFHERSGYQKDYEHLLDAWYEDNWANVEELNADIVLDEDWYERSKEESEDYDRTDPLDNPGFMTFLENTAKAYEEFPELKRANAAEWGFDPEIPSFDLVLRIDAKRRSESKAGYFANLSSPRSSVFWAKELVGRLPGILEREDVLGRHPFTQIGDQIPAAHRTLFEQAHMLYLFDFDIPCILTCGTLVEELVEKEFPDLNEKWLMKQSLEHKSVSWKAKVSDIVLLNPRFREAKMDLLDVYSVRNYVAHDPAAYLTTGGNSSEKILRKTRRVLEIFFDVANSQVEGK